MKASHRWYSVGQNVQMYTSTGERNIEAGNVSMPCAFYDRMKWTTSDKPFPLFVLQKEFGTSAAFFVDCLRPIYC